MAENEGIKVAYLNAVGGIVKNGPGRLFGFQVNAGATQAGRIKLFDNTTSSGDVLGDLSVAAAGIKVGYVDLSPNWVEFSTGLFAEFTGSDAWALVYYK